MSITPNILLEYFEQIDEFTFEVLNGNKTIRFSTLRN